MAQGQVASMHSAAAPSPAATLTLEEMQQIKECEKIIRFRDEVLSGSHPRIKIPAHLVTPKPSTNGSASSTDHALVARPALASSPHNAKGLVNGTHGAANLQSFQANAQRPAATPVAAPSLPGLGAFSNNVPMAPASRAASRLFGSGAGKVEIDPVLLQKSDDLIKAEIQLQRQRLERALRDQLEQQRAAARSLQAEPLADFDLKEVLEKALELVQKTAAQPTDTNLAANPSREETDSFDDNTFYSSRHDTPESPQLSRIPAEAEGDVDMREGSDYEPQLNMESVVPAPARPQPAFISSSGPSAHHFPPYQQQPEPTAAQQPPPASSTGRHTSNKLAPHGVPALQAVSPRGKGVAVGLADPKHTENGKSSDRARLEALNQQLLDEAFRQQHSPILRGHNLSPVAPQPAHVSPLAVARQVPPVVERDANIPQGAPAQVAALRKDVPSASSPESSPQGKLSKKAKKKKRKADRQVVEAGASPYIKPEPKSPSPMSAPQFARPLKRQRQAQSQQLGVDLSYDEPRYETQTQGGPLPRPAHSVYRDERASVVYERRDDYYPHQESRQPVVLAEAPRYEAGYYDEHRPGEAVYVTRRAEPGGAYPVYAQPEIRAVHPVPQAVVERPYREAPVYYADAPEYPRASARPVTDRDRSRSPAMGPPRALPPRIIVDEFGREYIEPPRPPTVMRQSVAPPTTRPLGEPDVIYGRPPPVRAASRMPGQEAFDDEAVLYRRASPGPYAVPRRVVTQPEFANPEYRAYRQREYPVRPVVAPPGDGYVQVRAPPQAGPMDAPPREYMARAMSVRPAEPLRYEAPADYGGRLHSARPEPIPREYAASVRPDGRREVMQPPPVREYSVRPTEAPQMMRREYSVRPVEPPQYYERTVRGDEDVAFIERPRVAPQDVIYGDGIPRPVYR